jgi:hypothetical protein
MNTESVFRDRARGWRALSIVGLAAVLIGGLSGCAHSRPKDDEHLVQMSEFEDIGPPGTRIWRGSLHVKGQLRAPATIEVTSKGNGTLEFDRFNVPVLDEHDDGFLFEPRLLHILNTDYDGDGYKDLLIFGERLSTEEPAESPDRSWIFIAFVFDTDTGRYRVAADPTGAVTTAASGTK